MMIDITELTHDELNALYIATVGMVRYYYATDCPDTHRNETILRTKADNRYHLLSAEYTRRKLIPPVVK